MSGYRWLCLVLVASLAWSACSDDSSATDHQDATRLDTSADGDVEGLDAPPSGDASDASDDADGGGVVDVPLSDASDDTALFDAFDGGDDAPTGPTLTIVVEGSLDDLEIEDGSAGQTPEPYRYGLQRLEMLTSPTSEDPALVFDHSPDQVLVDMLGRTEVAHVPMSELPDGSYTHFRILLNVLEARVDATVHDIPSVGTLELPLDLTYALSDVDNDDYDMSQGDAVIVAGLGGPPIEQNFPVEYPEPSPGAWAESVDGQTFVTFRLAEPLVISSETPVDATYVILFYVHESFRWTDLRLEGYAAGEWDVSLAPAGVTEEVVRFGANGFAVFAE